MNKFEKESLKQIDQLNEGLFGGMISRWIDRTFLRIAKQGYKDPELRAAFDAYNNAAEDFKTSMEGHIEKMKIIKDPDKDTKTKLKMLKKLGFKIK
jgi:hypothetical protein